MDSDRVVMRNWGHQFLGWVELLLGVPLTLLSIPVAFIEMPRSLFLLMVAPAGWLLVWHGFLLAMSRVVADASGMDLRGWRRIHIGWDEVRSIDVPEAGVWTGLADWTAAMATVTLTSGQQVVLPAVAAWLRPTFWRSGTPKKLARKVAALRAMHARYRSVGA